MSDDLAVAVILASMLVAVACAFTAGLLTGTMLSRRPRPAADRMSFED